MLPKNRLALIGLIILVLLVVIGVSILFAPQSSAPTLPTGQPNPSTSSRFFPPAPPGAPPQFTQPETDPLLTELPPSPAPLVIPEGDTLTINGVQVRNFYPTSQSVDSQGTLSLIQDPNFTILYYPTNQQFLISITGSPFETYRQQAETVFLAQLSVTESVACALSVDITTPGFANPDQAGKNFPLSFCPEN